MFENRADAGRQLANALKHYRNQDVVVLALPRGGVPVAVEIAKELDAPLSVIIVRKVGVPYQPELAMGAVADGAAPVIVRNDDVLRRCGVSEDVFQNVCAKELKEIERRSALYLGKKSPINVKGRIVILVDDGIATGASVRVAILRLQQRKPRKIVLAVPVGASETLEALSREVDAVVCLEEPLMLQAIGCHYRDFAQLTNEEVMDTLSSSASR